MQIHKEKVHQQRMTQLKMDALQEVLERSTTYQQEDWNRVVSLKQAKFMHLMEVDNEEDYFTTLKRLMIGGIEEELQAICLAPQLTGKIQQLYTAMIRGDATNYSRVDVDLLH